MDHLRCIPSSSFQVFFFSFRNEDQHFFSFYFEDNGSRCVGFVSKYVGNSLLEIEKVDKSLFFVQSQKLLFLFPLRETTRNIESIHWMKVHLFIKKCREFESVISDQAIEVAWKHFQNRTFSTKQFRDFLFNDLKVGRSDRVKGGESSSNLKVGKSSNRFVDNKNYYNKKIELDDDSKNYIASRILSENIAHFQHAHFFNMFECRKPEQKEQLQKQQEALNNIKLCARFVNVLKHFLLSLKNERVEQQIHNAEQNRQFRSQSNLYKQSTIDHQLQFSSPLSQSDSKFVSNISSLGSEANFVLLIDCLKRFVCTYSDRELFDKKVFFHILRPLGFEMKQSEAFRLLTYLKVLQPNSNVHRIRHEILTNLLHPLSSSSSSSFSSSTTIMTEFDQLKEQLKEEEEQQQQQHFRNNSKTTKIVSSVPLGYEIFDDKMTSFTIDSIDTTDIDDAIAVEINSKNEVWVHVHISDPTSLIRPNEELDLKVRLRPSSIYLPEVIHHMLPPTLVQKFSITESNKQNPVLTFSGQLDPNTGELKQFRICPHILFNVKRTDYDQIDSLLQHGKVELPLTSSEVNQIELMSKLANARKQWRIRNGAQGFSFPKAHIKLDRLDNSKVLLNVKSESSPSETLVSEMMVLAGQIAATFAHQNQIPIPFRFQTKTSSFSSSENDQKQIISVVENATPLVSYYKQMINSNPAELSVNAARHSGLGLDFYCRATSPIRRYNDIIVHYQLKAFLRHLSQPFSSSTLQPIVDQVARLEHQIKELQKKSESFWLHQYLMQNQLSFSNKYLDGIVMDVVQQKNGSFLNHILIPQIALITKKRIDRPLQIGQEIKMKLKLVDPFFVTFDVFSD